MGIQMICVKRHHEGEEDYWAPAVFCDACGDRIENAADGNYYWNWHAKGVSEEDWYKSRMDLAFGHKRCDPMFRAVALSGELTCFPIYLAGNLGRIHPHAVSAASFRLNLGAYIGKRKESTR